MKTEQYLIKWNDGRCDWYFSRFEWGYPTWVGKNHIKDARVFEGPKSAVRQWIRDNLNNHKYEIVKKEF